MTKPEERLQALVRDMSTALGANLRSILLYGSAARGDHAGANSDLNVMVVVVDGSPEDLEPAAPVQKKWVRGGNPPFLIVTAEWILNSTDVFPLEFTDMVAAHRMLLGESPLSGVRVSDAHLRHQCEHEIRSIVLRLRAAYLDAYRKASHLEGLLITSFGSVTTVARAALRLSGEAVPARNEELFDAVARRFSLSAPALRAAAEIKHGRKEKDRRKMKRIFLDWFDQVAALGRALDAVGSAAPGPSGQEH
jgi:hypothetical protein